MCLRQPNDDSVLGTFTLGGPVVDSADARVSALRTIHSVLADFDAPTDSVESRVQHVGKIVRRMVETHQLFCSLPFVTKDNFGNSGHGNHDATEYYAPLSEGDVVQRTRDNEVYEVIAVKVAWTEACSLPPLSLSLSAHVSPSLSHTGPLQACINPNQGQKCKQYMGYIAAPTYTLRLTDHPAQGDVNALLNIRHEEISGQSFVRVPCVARRLRVGGVQSTIASRVRDAKFVEFSAPTFTVVSMEAPRLCEQQIGEYKHSFHT